MKADPNRFPKRGAALRTLRLQLQVMEHQPHIGVTQGGSSRKDAGAKVAATRGRAPASKET